METEDVEFVGAAGAPLAGVLHRPAADARGSVLLAHCFTCSKDLHTMTRLARGLADAGYAVLRFDFTGLGESDGAFADTTVSSNVGDLTSAAMALINRGYGPCALLGHSLGGAASLLAAARLHTVRSIVVLGAPSTPTHLTHLFDGAIEEIRDAGEGQVTIAGRSFTVSAEFLDDLEGHEQRHQVAELGRPLLVIHAVDDEIVPVTEGEAIFAAAAQPKAFVPVLDADHLLSDRAAAERVLGVVTDWLDWTL